MTLRLLPFRYGYHRIRFVKALGFRWKFRPYWWKRERRNS